MSKPRYTHQHSDVVYQAGLFNTPVTRIKNHHRYYLLGVYNSRKTANYWAKGDEYNPDGFVVKVISHQWEEEPETGYAVYTYYPQEE